jgi:hypothetical protein
VPAVFRARPVPQNFVERIGVKLLLLLSILFPVYWLLQNLELLIIYLLSIAALLITMIRGECTRCAHLNCSHNIASHSEKKSIPPTVQHPEIIRLFRGNGMFNDPF